MKFFNLICAHEATVNSLSTLSLMSPCAGGSFFEQLNPTRGFEKITESDMKNKFK
jgi:hypothetical protein